MTKVYWAHFDARADPYSANPTADIGENAWVASTGMTNPLYPTVDEPTTPNDSDYSYTEYLGACEFKIPLVLNSDYGNPTIKYRIRADSGGMVVKLKCGTTTIATWTHASVPTSYTTYTQTLSNSETTSIVDPSDVRVSIEATN